MEKEERAKEKAREKKKRADTARKERRKAEDAARAEALDVLRAATEGEDSEKLAAALKALLQIGGVETPVKQANPRNRTRARAVTRK